MINYLNISVLENLSEMDELTFNEIPERNSEDNLSEVITNVLKVESNLTKGNDPVRMYMKEMGTVELLTKKGEINIAKKIENGIYKIQYSLVKYIDTINLFLKQYSLVKKKKIRLSDLILGFIDKNLSYKNFSILNNNNLENFSSSINNTNVSYYIDVDFFNKKFKNLHLKYKLFKKYIKKYGLKHPYTKYELNKLICIFMNFRLVPKQFNYLVDNIKSVINKIYLIEKKIIFLCIEKCLMPKKIFINFFYKHKTNYNWLINIISLNKRYL